MSDEKKRPRPLQAAISQHERDLQRLLSELDGRAAVQANVEDFQARIEESANFMAETFAAHVYNPDAEPDAIRCRELEEQHAVKFHKLTAPATVYPARGLTLNIKHPNIGNRYFIDVLTPALMEFVSYQAVVENPHIGSVGMVDIDRSRYPFTASNGVVFDVVAHVQLEPPPRDPAAPAQMVEGTFRRV